MSNLYTFLTESFYDRGIDYGQFFSIISRDGLTVIDDSFQIYAEAFTILGIAQYYAVTNDQRVIGYFEELFDDIDRNSHDTVYGGYNNTYDPYGNPYNATRKDVFAHLALLEALNVIYETDPTDLNVPPRLLEIFNIFVNTIIQPTNYCHQLFDYDWTLLGNPLQNYALDLEIVYTLRKTGQLLGLTNTSDPIVQVFGVPASDNGYDSTNGGYYWQGPPGAAPSDYTKRYWDQASALLGNWALYDLTKNPIYLDRIEGTIKWITTSQVDTTYGEWFSAVAPDGTFPDGTNKGTYIKSSFHPLRATIYLQNTINSYISSEF